MNAPTLLVGLGGTGSKIVQRVSRMISEEQRNSIAFAVFDTDVNELRVIEEADPLVRTIQTSTKETVGEYLSKDIHARDTWFPVNAILNNKTLTEGAGQVRAISRLAFEAAVRADKMEPLHEAIQSLYKVEEDKVEQALRVIIVSSLAGGTGSGLILPVGLYIKNYLATHFRKNSNITRGFFILPEVFYEVITRQTERNNLKVNAYATLRELDAFLMKADNTLPQRYVDMVRMQFPRPGSTEYEEYNIRPYDYCFLFDAQNADGDKLDSFDQYLDHAANCIYAQSIGPMNKRSNSSEDNTIRDLVKEEGRNRYAGAGASMLIYPFEDIKSFLALNWAKQCVSEQWLAFDNIYKEICQENSKMREQGINAQNPNEAQFYVDQVESMAKQNDPFAKAIIQACGTYSADGVTRQSNRWEEFVKGIIEKVSKDIEDGNSDLISVRAGVRGKLGELDTTDWDPYEAAYEELEKYRLMSNVYVENVVPSIAYSMFKELKPEEINSSINYKLESYLVSVDNKFLHPNAIRYFLIKTLDLMKKELMNIADRKKKNEDWFDTFEKKTFDDTETEGVTETLGDLADRKVSKFRWKPTGKQEEIKGKFKFYLANTDEYKVQCAQYYVLDRGIKHIESLIKSFEDFYKSFDSKVVTINTNINELYKKYNDMKGSTVRFVCSSKAYFDKLKAEKTYSGNAISIDSKLAQDIYYSVLEYSTTKEKQKSGKYFSKVFDEKIIGYFKDTVMREQGDDIDVDIITALEKEAEFEYRNEDSEKKDVLIQQYVRKTITDTRNLSRPFIESPRGEETDSINACAFNKSLSPEKGDVSPRAKLIRKELLNQGGVGDEDIEKNTIMFYQSYYGLRANTLSKFAPPEETMTYNRSAGEYYKAYYELIGGIHPRPEISKEVSPHIDRWWHIITRMPDLDDGNQEDQFHKVYAAFFWGILGRYIDLYEENRNKKVYKLNRDILKMSDDKLIVSNGSDCDKLYEVLDSIAIYPELATKIINKTAALVEDDLNENRSIEDGMLYKLLDRFSIYEPGLGKDDVPATSIFSIPMLMKKSATPDKYYEDNVIQILEIELRSIKDYLSRFCGEKELAERMGKIVLDQFDKYLADLGVESEIHRNIYRESLFARTCSIIKGSLEEIDLKEEADAVSEKFFKLKK